jgi:hypothetical protein
MPLHCDVRAVRQSGRRPGRLVHGSEESTVSLNACWSADIDLHQLAAKPPSTRLEKSWRAIAAPDDGVRFDLWI